MIYPQQYVASPWLCFTTGEGKQRWCQPDGLLIDAERGVVTCVEVKYSHTERAWWQVRQLYFPVLALLFPAHLWRLQACEVVKWFDGTIFFPEPTELTPEVSRPSDIFRIHIYRP